MPVTGELKQWHKTTVTFQGPTLTEAPETFTDYCLDVTFTHESGRKITVPGYFAADGNAADSNASGGNVWKAHLSAPLTGKWTYDATLVKGDNVAALPGKNGTEINLGRDGSGSFSIGRSDKSGDDARKHGTLGDFDNDGYLDRAGSGDPWLKTGVDSPENFLAYEGFDGTDFTANGSAVRYNAHRGDFENGDPTWDGGKGREIIGAVNFLADQGINSVYMVTMNAGGDGKDVFPWVDTDFRRVDSSDKNQNLKEAASRTSGLSVDDFVTYDVSKLDQWGIVFEHMQERGINLHLVLQEQENDQLLDNSALGYTDSSGTISIERAVYFREMVARFGHNNYITWNIGEESTASTSQREAMFDLLDDLDPYGHLISVHSFPDEQREVYDPLLGNPDVGGASLQTKNWHETHEAVRKWVAESEAAGDRWVVMADETTDASVGTEEDRIAPGQNELRSEGIWGALMGGAGGIEFYFGRNTRDNDINTDDFFGRQNVFEQAEIAREFFEDFIPFTEMENRNSLLDRSQSVTDVTATGNKSNKVEGYVLAKEDSVYLVYTEDGDADVELDLRGADGAYAAYWFDPFEGGLLELGTVETATGGRVVNFGKAPSGIIDNRVKDGIRGSSSNPAQRDAELLVKDAVLIVKNVSTDLGIDARDVKGGRLAEGDGGVFSPAPAPAPEPEQAPERRPDPVAETPIVSDKVDTVLRGTGNPDVFAPKIGTVRIDRFGKTDALLVPTAIPDGNGDGIIRAGSDGELDLPGADNADIVLTETAASLGVRFAAQIDGDYIYVRNDAGAADVARALAAVDGGDGAGVTVFEPDGSVSRFDTFDKEDILILSMPLADGNGDGLIALGSDRDLDLGDGSRVLFESGLGNGLRLATVGPIDGRAKVGYVRADASEALVDAAIAAAGFGNRAGETVRGAGGFDLFDLLDGDDLSIEGFGRDDGLLLPSRLPDNNRDGRIETGSDNIFDVEDEDGSFGLRIDGATSGSLQLAGRIKADGDDSYLYLDAAVSADDARTAISVVEQLFGGALDLADTFDIA